MLKKIQAFFAAEIEQENDTYHQVDLAAAALLVELMYTDGKLTTEEEQALPALLESILSLSPADIESLLGLAKDARHDSSDLYQFTRLVNDHFDYAKKCQLLEALWRVAFADNELDKYEEYTIRKIADLLYIDHVDFIKSKHAASASGDSPG